MALDGHKRVKNLFLFLHSQEIYFRCGSTKEGQNATPKVLELEIKTEFGILAGGSSRKNAEKAFCNKPGALEGYKVRRTYDHKSSN